MINYNFLEGNNNRNQIFADNPAFVAELQNITKFYKFFEGRPEGVFDDPDIEALPADGALWAIKRDKYEATRQIRNECKKLLMKQARFMFGTAPTIEMKPYNGKEDSKVAEDKRSLIDSIFENINMWGKTYTAFLDATIGKRVLAVLQLNKHNPARPIDIKYYPVYNFTYTYDPFNPEVLSKVQIVYQDESTLGAYAENQIWYRTTYEMRPVLNGNPADATNVVRHCFCKQETLDGNNVVLYDTVNLGYDSLSGEPLTEKVELVKEWDTELPIIPAYVILNDPLTGDTKGSSDVKDMIDMTTSYNRVNSDYHDALKYKMFEPVIFTDADQDDIDKMGKITPNGVYNIHSDPESSGAGTEGGGGTATTIQASATFNWQPAAEAYLSRLKIDMYELMDQPTPDQLKDVPSSKALKFLFFDLMGRCNGKWKEWYPFLKWLIDAICGMIVQFNLYPEKDGARLAAVQTNLVITQNFPIPEDEQEKRQIDRDDVNANVMSHKTYIKKYGTVEDEQAEWAEILKEQEELDSTANLVGLTDQTVGDTDDEDDNTNNDEGNEGNDEEDNTNENNNEENNNDESNNSEQNS